MTETPSNRHDDIGTSPRCPTEVIENKPICLCFPCCIRDLSCLDLALLPPHISHVLDRHKFPGGQPPYKSNFYCHPGRAGGTPMLLARLRLAVSAAQPTATTASAASALPRCPSLEKFIRTPVAVFSNDSMAPKFSCTSMPDARNAPATAAAT